MNAITKQVRELNTVYEDRIEKLEREYHKELARLQGQCDHTKTTRWSFFTNEYGEVAATADGVLIKSRECLLCGFIEYIEDRNILTEIPFNDNIC